MSVATVYRFFDADGDLLYVGSTADWQSRMGQHRSGRPWWDDVASITLEHHDSIDAARRAENEAIGAERPRHTETHAQGAVRWWEARAERAARLHAAGQFCGNSACRRCRLRRAVDVYAAVRGGADLIADVLEMRANGQGRWPVALTIRHRLNTKGLDFTVGMVELVEHEARSVA